MDLIFITGSGRCGTTLVRSLLDGHSNLNVYPKEISSFIENFYLSSGFSKHIAIENFKYSSLDVFYKGQSEKGSIIVDLDKINSNLTNTGTNLISPQDILKSIKNMTFNNQEYLTVFDVTSPNISGYLDAFSNCKIIHLLRHPFNTLNSMYRERYNDPNSFGGTHPGNWTLGKGLSQIVKSYQQANLYEKNESVYILQLEKLQKEPINEIKKLFQFIGLKHEDINFKQTKLGGLFSGNSTYKESDKIYLQPDDWSCLTPNDVFLLSKIPQINNWYKINEYPFALNSFSIFLKRQLGFYGKNRVKCRSLKTLLLKLIPATIGYYLQDLNNKSSVESFLDI